MEFSWESDEKYLKICDEVYQSVNKLTQQNYLDKVLEELEKEKSNLSKDDYILNLLRVDNFRWTIYGSYINLFQMETLHSKKDFDNWYENNLTNIYEKEKGGRWQLYASNALDLLQREFGFNKDKIIQALETRFIRDKVILELSKELYFKLMNTSFHQDILKYINSNMLASAMFGSALNKGTDKFLTATGYRSTKIQNFNYFDFCGYR